MSFIYSVLIAYLLSFTGIPEWLFILAIFLIFIFGTVVWFRLIQFFENIPMFGKALTLFHGVIVGLFVGLSISLMFGTDENISSFIAIIICSVLRYCCNETNNFEKVGFINIILSGLLYGASAVLILGFGLGTITQLVSKIEMWVQMSLVIIAFVFVFVLFIILANNRNIKYEKIRMQREKEEQEYKENVKKAQEEFKRLTEENLNMGDILIKGLMNDPDMEYSQLEVMQLTEDIKRFRELKNLYEAKQFYLSEYNEIVELINEMYNIGYNASVRKGKNDKFPLQSQINEQKDNIFFSGCSNVEELSKRYKNLCKAYHPDVYAGDEETFKAIHKEYELLMSRYQNSDI